MINIAYSGGVESVHMLLKALSEGHDVNLCVINVTGNRERFLFELTAARLMAKYIKEESAYSGNILKIIGVSKTFQVLLVDKASDLNAVRNTVTQQYNTAVGMLAIRSQQPLNDIAQVWIGWLKEDASESSYSDFDHSEEAYYRLLNLPALIGDLSNADNIGKPFRAPLWDMSKKEIFDMIPEKFYKFMTINGRTRLTLGQINKELISTAYEGKLKEYRKVGITLTEKNTLDRIHNDKILFSDKLFCGLVSTVDLSIDKRYRELVKELSSRDLPFIFGLNESYDKDLAEQTKVYLRGLFQSLDPKPNQRHLS